MKRTIQTEGLRRQIMLKCAPLPEDFIENLAITLVIILFDTVVQKRQRGTR